jgi:polysaccharide export outer membrane protein
MFPAMQNLTLMDALALGQGVDNYGKESEILVFRRQQGQRYVARFDLGMIQDGAAVDPEILPGDVVVVGYSNSRRFFGDFVAVLPATVGIFLALIK